jgi:hypothetical protein
MDMNAPVPAAPRFWDELIWKIKRFFQKKEESNLIAHAKREFKAAGYKPIAECEDDPNKWIQENVLELLEVFEKQGHSGFSAGYCREVFMKLAAFQPLAPLSGKDDEWVDVSSYSGQPMWQNNRCSHVFKEADGRPYDMDGRIFREPDGGCYTNRDSRVYIEFPYTPKREYVDVPFATEEGNAP